MPGNADQGRISPVEGDAGIGDRARPETSPLAAWLVRRQGLVVRLGALTIVLAFIVLGLVLWLTGWFNVETVGYAGVWLLSFIGAASIIVPVPGLAAVCVAATPAVGLDPLVIGVIAGSAEALGEMTGYMAGVGGKTVLQRHRLYPRVRDLLLRRGGIIVFAGSVIPNPLFDIMGIAAGSTAYPLRRFLVIVLAAKSIKSTWIAYACLLGVEWITRFAG